MNFVPKTTFFTANFCCARTLFTTNFETSTGSTTDFSFVGNFCQIFPLFVPHAVFVIPLLLQRENQP